MRGMEKVLSEPFGLYLVVTNPLTSYERCCEAAVAAGIKFVQLRLKHAPRETVLEHARNFRSITSGSQTRFILNDNPEWAVEVGADGVHLGQSDGNLAEARRACPQLKVFGLSTHSPAQAQAAARVAPDYIGVGPVFATPTKEIPDPTLGISRMAEMVSAAPCPAVAIGGIDHQNLRSVLEAGARNFAVVRDVCRSTDPLSAISRLQDIWHEVESHRN